ncbi:MAG: hypothetical protein KAU01_03325 [Candidatus Cloacimonetes bacterium]|nr:hypothetical protein [Candidatus Cloacimonadota bacterium]
MEQTLIQRYSSSIISCLLEKAASIKKMKHSLSKGQFRELFITDLLKHFLPHQFDIGSGIIVNQKGEQSHQTDLVIYDKSILPPFISESISGVFPIESVIATIEVKSTCSKTEFMKVNEKADNLNNVIADGKKSMYFNEKSTLYSLTKSVCNSNDNKIKFYIHNFKPLNGIFAFYGYGPNDLSDSELGKKYLNHKIKNIFGICLLNKFCWMNLGNWCLNKNISSHDEVKRFIAVFIDNILTKAYFRNRLLSSHHFDFNSIYIRDQVGIVKFFEKYS